MSKAKKRTFLIVAIFASLLVTGASAVGFVMTMQRARHYEAIAAIWSRGPGRSPFTAGEVKAKALNYEVRAADTRASAYRELTQDLMTLVLIAVGVRLVTTRRKSQCGASDRG